MTQPDVLSNQIFLYKSLKNKNPYLKLSLYFKLTKENLQHYPKIAITYNLIIFKTSN